MATQNYNLPLEEKNISGIYLEGTESILYQIPIYQRNYAWEEDEIKALVEDVYDSFQKDRKSVYYIGTLVTYKRDDKRFEVIDGQQRLTTIYLILKALGIKDIKNKLTYTARKISASTIEKLPNFGEESDAGIKNGFKYAENSILRIILENELETFKNYFLSNVHIIHYHVPKDVDLNHYFEVMNSRGEQLEKHEIVKSTLSQYLQGDEIATFSRVWEACSEMSMYIQQVFPEEGIFGNKLDEFSIHSFYDIPKQKNNAGRETILNLLNSNEGNASIKEDIEYNDRFQSIIDFPNFLLIVLKLTLLRDKQLFEQSFTLDDKELINEFDKALLINKGEEARFVKEFAFNLIRGKYFLDNYMVHHTLSDREASGDNPWLIEYYQKERGTKAYPKNLIAEHSLQQELVHLLSMFEVAFTAKQRKNYLFYCLVYLFDNNNVNQYLEFARQLAHKYFYDVYLNSSCLNERNQPAPNAFDNAILKDCKLNLKISNIEANYETFTNIYKQGRMNIPLYVFNYTDYAIWKKYSDELRGKETKVGDQIRNTFFEKLGCNDFGLEMFNNFYFSRTRKSLEHYYPQSKAVKEYDPNNEKITTTQINCFGNFAMIGAEANSSGSNWDPRTKLDHYSDGKSNPVSVASLKFKIMMQICQDNYRKMLNGELKRPDGMEWNYDDMMAHQEKMLKLIFELVK